MTRNRLIWPTVTAIIAAIGVYSISQAANEKPAQRPANVVAASAPKPVESTKSGNADAAPPATDERSAVERALDRPIDLKFKETPLKDVADAIGVKAGINVLLDNKNLTDAGITADMPINFGVGHPISLRAALRLLLAEHEMNFIVESDNVLLLTSETKAKEHVVLRIYDAHDLAPPVHKLDGTELRLDELIDLISSTISPTTWTAAGGTGSIVSLGTQIIVVQTAEVHEQIAELLQILRQVRDDPQKFIAAGGRIGPSADSPEGKILAALQTRQDFDFHATPLGDVAAALSKRGIAVQLDSKALTDAGVTHDTPITFTIKNTRLDVALRLMLQDHEMTYIIDHEVLLITSDTKSKEHVTTSFYPVADFIGNPAGRSPEEIDETYRSLIDVITTTVLPTTWDAAGGTGSLTPFPLCNVLVCSQTREGHEEACELIAKLRAGRRGTKGAAIAKPADPAALLTRFYRLSPDHADAAADYAEVIRHLVEPKSWTGSDVYLGKVPGAIVARCPPATHERIHALLNEMEALPRPPIAPAKPAGGLSGGFGGGADVVGPRGGGAF